MNNIFEEKSISKAVLKLGIPAMLGSLTTLIYNTADTYFVSLTADEENFEYTYDYLRWIFIGTPAIMLSNGLVHSFRSIGLIKEATIGLAIGNGVNIVFDWILIVLLKMGTKGAAIATSFGFVCAAVYYIICLMIQERKKNECVKMSLRYFSCEKEMTGNVIKIGIPGALITVMLSVANIVLNNFIGIYGSDAVASYGIAYKIDMFPIMLSVGLSQGTAPLVGYCYGQKNEKRLACSMRVATMYGVVLSFQNETFHLEIAHRFYRKTFLNHLGQDEIY